MTRYFEETGMKITVAAALHVTFSNRETNTAAAKQGGTPLVECSRCCVACEFGAEKGGLTPRSVTRLGPTGPLQGVLCPCPLGF